MGINQLIARGGNNRVGSAYIEGRQAGQQEEMNALNMAMKEFELGQAQDQASRSNALRAALANGNEEAAREAAPIAADEFLGNRRQRRANIEATEATRAAQELETSKQRFAMGAEILSGINDAASYEQARPALARIMEQDPPEEYDPQWVERAQSQASNFRNMTSNIGRLVQDKQTALERGDSTGAEDIQARIDAITATAQEELDGTDIGSRLSNSDLTALAESPQGSEVQDAREAIMTLPEDHPLRQITGSEPEEAYVFNDDGERQDEFQEGQAERAAGYWATQAKAYQELSGRLGDSPVSYQEALRATRSQVEAGLRTETNEQLEPGIWNSTKGFFGQGETEEVEQPIWRTPSQEDEPNLIDRFRQNNQPRRQQPRNNNPDQGNSQEDLPEPTGRTFTHRQAASNPSQLQVGDEVEWNDGSMKVVVRAGDNPEFADK